MKWGHSRCYHQTENCVILSDTADLRPVWKPWIASSDSAKKCSVTFIVHCHRWTTVTPGIAHMSMRQMEMSRVISYSRERQKKGKVEVWDLNYTKCHFYIFSGSTSFALHISRVRAVNQISILMQALPSIQGVILGCRDDYHIPISTVNNLNLQPWKTQIKSHSDCGKILSWKDNQHFMTIQPSHCWYLQSALRK